MVSCVESTKGVAVAVHDLGGPADPDVPVLLLAHATGFHGRVYGPMAAGLTDRFRCIAPDLRGHGDSKVPDGVTYEWRGMADDVSAVVESLSDPRPAVYGFGHSMGGAALVMAELAAPGTFAGLYLFEPILPPPGVFDLARPNPMAEAAERRREVFESFDAAYDNYAGKPPLDVMTPEALRAYVDFGFEQQADDGTVRLKCRGAVEAATFRMSGQHNTFDRLDEVTCPVTVAMGEPMESGPAAFAPAIVERLPHAHLARFPHLGHFAPMQAPDEVAASLLSTLAR